MKKLLKIIMIMNTTILLAFVFACSSQEDINPEFHIVSLYRTKINYIENDHDYFIISSYDDYLKLEIPHNKEYEEYYFKNNVLVLVNFAKSQGVKLDEVSFKIIKTTLSLDIKLEYEFGMEFDGFSVLIEVSNRNIKEVLVREI